MSEFEHIHEWGNPIQSANTLKQFCKCGASRYCDQEGNASTPSEVWRRS